jgi:alpha-tubulin suppressor-like RCC1 family protein
MALLAAIPLPLPAVAIAVGGEHTCALLDDSTVRCWGENSSGQLGRGNPDDQGDAAGEIAALTAIDLGTGRTALAIAAGVTHTCARLDNSTVKCWGDNDFGQLGLGNTASRGDDAGEMGDLLPAIDLGTGRTVLAITAGQDGSCAGLDNFTVKCWGYNLYGQLGLGNTANRGDGINEMGDNLPAIALGTDRTVAAISSGLFHNCALLDDGTGRCWGYNIFGQLGQGDIGNRGDGGGEMGNNLLQINVGTL